MGRLNRRNALKSTAIIGAGLAGLASAPANLSSFAQETKVRRFNIKQSVMGWCFNPMPTKELAETCRDIGIVAMEGVSSEHYPMITEMGLKIALVGSHGFSRGPVNPANHAFCIETLKKSIDTAVRFKAPSVITFTGMREPGIGDSEAAENCVRCWKDVVPYAEEKGINLCLEHLNSKDRGHPMKGHPGYFGDDVDFCVELIKRVGSPRMKLLFDIYHVQIMNGDVITRLKAYKDVIGHIHTAGNPGRAELDENQEINYPAVMRAIVDMGYEGFVAQEFIPTWEDKKAALRHAALLCDV